MSAQYIDLPAIRGSNGNEDRPVSDFYDGQEEDDYYTHDGENAPVARVSTSAAPAETGEREQLNSG